MAGMAAAIPIRNVVWRRHRPTNKTFRYYLFFDHEQPIVCIEQKKKGIAHYCLVFLSH